MVSKLNEQVLLIDADDTLWENSVYFERVIAAVAEILAERGVRSEAFREHLNEMERESIAVNGYGTEHFARSLVASFESFVAPPPDRAAATRVGEMALDIMNRPIELFEGVPETLEYLSHRHELHLVTKGSPGEQTRKIGSSGIARFFSSIEVVREKDEATYRELVRSHRWQPDATWMIGNSPRSDVNPALAAGLNAVFIPHTHTWVLEHDEPLLHPRLLSLRSFPELRDHF